MLSGDLFGGAYMQVADVQPSIHYQQHLYGPPQACASTPSYDMTAGGGGSCAGGGPGGGGPPAHHQHHPPHHDPRKRRISHFNEEYEPMSGCEGPVTAPQTAPMPTPSRRRKASSYGTGSAYGDDSEDGRSTRTLPDKKQNHSEIEKRRRDKMNTYISELSALVPVCGAMARKLDKLTVLRLAVQHLRGLRGALSSCPLTSCPRPAYVTERELNALVLAVARDAFLIVVSCDRGRLLYVSASVTRMLHYDKCDLLGQSLFDILHPKDVAKVKEQLSSSDLSPRERLIDAKTMLPLKTDMGSSATRLCPGARRSFYCRIKTKAAAGSAEPPPAAGPVVKEELDSATKLNKKHERKYCVVQCTGYLKAWTQAEMESGEGGCEGGEEDGGSVTCLVAVGRSLQELAPAPAPQQPSAQAAPPRPPTRKLQFLSRHAPDGKYLFVDQRVTLVLGYLPQELLGTSLYEYVSSGELAAVARAHKTALVQRTALRTSPYAVRRKDGSYAVMQSQFKPFRNPWTKEMECLVAENTVLAEGTPRAHHDAHSHAEGCGAGAARAGGAAEGCTAEYDAEVQRLIDSHVESHKIGSAIAEEALRRSPGAAVAGFPLDLPPELLADALLYTPAHDDTTFSAHQGAAGLEGEAGAGAGGEGGSPTLSLDGNNEAAMAVIMSLLEADAGLGGPVNFSGLPWPLP